MEEDGISTLLGALIALGVIGYILYSIVRLFIEVAEGYSKFSKGYQVMHNPSDLTEDHPAVTSTLNKFPYYKLLSSRAKERFADRVVVFLEDKKFVGMNGLVLNDDMRILISAAAVQITFGLDKYLLPLFHTIRVYPEEFFSKLAEAELKGGTTPNGLMMLSWKDFLKGYVIPDDKLNLGMHEMAHALILDMLHGDIPHTQLQEEIGNWESVADPEILNLRQKRSNFLRAYGGTNEHEFFAVSVEHFFEAPAQFRERLPHVYSRLCRLLNQDPANISGDYALRGGMHYA